MVTYVHRSGGTVLRRMGATIHTEISNADGRVLTIKSNASQDYCATLHEPRLFQAICPDPPPVSVPVPGYRHVSLPQIGRGGPGSIQMGCAYP